MLFIVGHISRSHAPSSLSRFKIKFCDLRYTWCCIVVKERYADGSYKSTVKYSNAARFFNCIFVPFVLAEELHVHSEYRLGALIVRHTLALRVKHVLYLEVGFRKSEDVYHVNGGCLHEICFWKRPQLIINRLFSGSYVAGFVFAARQYDYRKCWYWHSTSMDNSRHSTEPNRRSFDIPSFCNYLKSPD